LDANQLALIDCYQQLVTALTTQDICQLDHLLATTAELHLINGRTYAKYDWIDAIQNETLRYQACSTPDAPQLTMSRGTLQVQVKWQIQGNTARTDQQRLTFVQDCDGWRLLDQCPPAIPIIEKSD